MPNGDKGMPVDGTVVPYIALGGSQVGKAILGRGMFTITNLNNRVSINGVVYADNRGDNEDGVEISPAAADALQVLYYRRGAVYGYIDEGLVRKCPPILEAVFTGNTPRPVLRLHHSNRNVRLPF
jgi:hypothetical protein